jgi:type VI protein secretion system component Hcp
MTAEERKQQGAEEQIEDLEATEKHVEGVVGGVDFKSFSVIHRTDKSSPILSQEAGPPPQR